MTIRAARLNVRACWRRRLPAAAPGRHRPDSRATISAGTKMAKAVAPIAGSKFSRPRLPQVAARHRLFHALDEANAPVVWICAPPGSGKTTLVASYLEARQRPVIWYQVDAEDADPASFFHFMDLACAQSNRRGRRALPLWPAESPVDLPAFAHRYFRAMFSLLPRTTVLVFDNFQEAASAPFEALIREALTQVPEGVTVLITSRTDPPPALARLVANRAIESIDTEQLRFTLDESKSVVRAKLALDEPAMIALHERSGGWAAGLVLMTEHLRRLGPRAGAPNDNSQDAVFDYFAGEILAHAPLEDQRVLMLTASLPRMTPSLASAATGTQDAGRLLEYLYRQHLFTDRRGGPEYVYQYHGLFRAFLRARAAASLTAAERTNAACRAARELEAGGHTEDAVALFLEAEDWTSASRLIESHARRLYEHGRWRTLTDWIAAIPARIADEMPWLAYWAGACEVWRDPAGARRQLERAFEGFAAIGDRPGQILAAGALSRAGILAADWNPLDRWIAALEALLAHDTAGVPAQTRITGLSRLVYATLARQPQHPRLPEWAARLSDALGTDIDANEMVLAGFSLMAYCNSIGDTARQEYVIRQIQPLLANPELGTETRTYWTWAHANHVLRVGAPRDALVLLDEAIELAASNGLAIAGVLARHRLGYYLTNGDLARAEAEVKQLELAPRIEPYFEMKAWLALLRGDLALAAMEAQNALRMATERGRTHYRILDLHLLAQVAAEAGEFDRALSYVNEYRAETSAIAAPMLEYLALLVEAYVALRRHDREQCLRSLRPALAIGQRHGFYNHWAWCPAMMVRLYSAALADGIATDYVQEVIGKRGLLPESPAIEGWPWLVKICTLGRFEVRRNDQPIHFEGKTQRKPFEFLKVLIALGGQDVPADKLIEFLWPKSFDNGGQKSFDITAHRVRKLMGSEDALLVTDRRATLNRQIVWVDVWALERALAPGDPFAQDAATETARLDGAAARVLNLYQGHFLAGDTPTPWQLPMKNRLSGQFHRFVLRLGERWEALAQWNRAAELYQRAIDLDPLAEAFYRRQMVCLHAQGQRAEAIAVFRRCRQTLSIVLGVPPNGDTEAVYRELLRS